MADELPRRFAERLWRPPAGGVGGLFALAAIGIIGVVSAGTLFAAGFALLPPLAAPRPIAAGAAHSPPAPPPGAIPPAIARAAPPPGAVPALPTPAIARAAPAPSPKAIAAAPTKAVVGRATPAVVAPPALPANRLSAAAGFALAQGDKSFQDGEVLTARFYYERAVDAGDAKAAVRMGETFDPEFLVQGRLRRVRGDPVAARIWYRRAAELGEPAGQRRLDHLEAEPTLAGAPAGNPDGTTFHQLLERILHPPRE